MNYRVINTKTGASLVVNEHGFASLIASHTALMSPMLGAIEANIIRDSVMNGGWESAARGMRIEKTSENVTYTGN